METKTCKKCGNVLPLSEFYTHKQTSDGYLNFCKNCVKNRIYKHRAKNIDKIREYDRNRPNAKERAIKQKISLKNNPERMEKLRKQKKEWDIKNKNKRQAHNKIEKALKTGKIIKPNKCENCGKSNCNIAGHHYDYSKPLDIIWLCNECHGAVHRKYNKLKLDIEQIKTNRKI